MNVILLPKANFAIDMSTDSKLSQTANITDLSSISHIKNVLKLSINDTVKIGQLGGNLGKARIAHITDISVVLDEVTLNQPPPPKLGSSIILALPRPKVLRRLIMDMTALGVNNIILVNSHRSQKSYWQSPLLQRVPEFVLEGLQQAVDTVAPNIYVKKRLRPFVEDELGFLLTQVSGQSRFTQARLFCATQTPSFDKLDFYPTAMIAHPYANNELLFLLSALNRNDNARPPYVIAIGAEGGWIDFEVELFKKQGFVAMRHGQRILRTEAAVNAILGGFIC